MTTEAQTQVQTAPSDLEQAVAARKAQAAQQTAATQQDKPRVKLEEQKYDMTDNVFWKYISDADTSPEEKRDGIAEKLTYNDDQSADENRKRLIQYDYFKQFMTSVITKRAKAMLQATDQTNMVDLQAMTIGINEAVIHYTGSMVEQKEIVNALAHVRKSGDPRMLLKLYQALPIEDARKAAHDLKVANFEKEIANNKTKVDLLKSQITHLEGQTNLMGNIKKANREPIKRLTAEKDALIAFIGKPGYNDIEATGQYKDLAFMKSPAGQPEEMYPDFHDDKAALRKLRDLDGAAWLAKSKALIDNATGFIEEQDGQGQKVLAAQIRKQEQVNELTALVDQMEGAFEVLADAENMARDKNKRKFDLLDKDTSGDKVDQGDRSRKAEAIGVYLEKAERSKLDTQNVLENLTQQRLVLTTYRKSLEDAISDARTLIGSTLANVTISLALTVNTIGSAAVDAAELMAEDATRVVQDENNTALVENMERNGTAAEMKAVRILAHVEDMNKFFDTALQIMERNDKGLDDQAKAAAAAAGIRDKIKEGISKMNTSEARRIITTPFNDASTGPGAANDDAPVVSAGSRKAPGTEPDVDAALKGFGMR